MMKSYFSSQPGTPWRSLALAALLSGSSLAAYAAGGPPAKHARPTAANDAAVTTIYTYGRLATPRALPHAVQAVITNAGTDFLVDFPVTLTVTGSNSFTNVQRVPVLAAGASTTVTFSPFPTSFTTGSNTVTVTVPDDDNNTNNSAAQVQRMTTGRVSYIDTTATLSGTPASVGTAGGTLAVKYTLLTSTTYLNAAVATFAAGTAGTYQVQVYDATGSGGTPGTLLYTSAVRTRAAAASSATVPLPGVQVGSSFFIALKELDSPLGVATQNESPLRPNVFYTQAATGGAWTAVTAQTRRALDVVVGPAPTCPVPTAITASSNAGTSAVVSFTAPTGGTQYTVVYVLAGTTPTSTSPSVSGTASPITITGLTANTRYDIYVTAACGTTSSSAQAGPVQVTTACRTYTYPYTENFDGVTAPNLPCGITVLNANNDGTTWATSTVGSNSAPNSMRYMYSGANAANDWFFTPGLPMTVGKSYQLQFKYRGYGSLVEGMEVKAGNSATVAGQTTTLFTNTSFNSATYTTTTGGSGTGQVALFTPTASGTYYFGFHAISAANQWYIYVDDLVVTEINTPNCAAPTNISVTNATLTGATVSFTAAAGSSSYTLIYGPAGFTPGGANSTSVLVSGSSYTLSGLTAATSYDVYVQANCTAGGTSLNSPVVNFSTACRTYTFPFTENFDGVTAPTLPCGITVADSNNDGTTWATSTVGANSAPNSMRYMYSGSNAANDWFFTPGLPLIVGKSYQLQFKYRGYGSLTEAMEVKVGTSASPAGQTTTLFSNTSFNSDTYTTTTTGSGTNQVMLFTPTAAGTYYFGFHAISPANQWYIYVDDVTVQEINTPNCAAPTGLTVTNPTTTSATVTFTASAGSSGYTLFYGPRGFVPGGTGSTSVTVTTSPYTLNGLTQNTNYDVYLQATCTAGGTSLLSSVASFTTACAAVSTFPYTENFDGVTAPALPCGITVLDANGDNTTWVNSATTPSSTPNSMRYTTSTNNAANDWFFTQALTLQGGITYQLRFKYRTSSATLAEALEVKAGTGLTAASQTTTLFTNSAIATTTYVTTATGTASGQVAPFTPTISGTYYIGFHVISPASRGSLNVDDVEVTATGTVACPSPSNVQVGSITATSASVSFTTPTNGTSYTVVYVPTGTTPTSTSPSVSGTASPITITGLTFSTVYDVYVQATCSGSTGNSTLTGPTTFTTACAPATLPYAENFDAVTAPSLACNITVLDANNDNSTWVTAAANPASSPNAMRYQFNAINTANDWFFSAGLPLVAGTPYQLRFKYRGQNSTPEALEVKVGTATTAAGQTTTLFSNLNISTANYITPTSGTGAGQVAPFTPSTTGTYYFGFHALSTNNGFALYVDDVSVSQVLGTRSSATPGFSAEASPVPFGDRLSVSLSTLQAGAVQLTLHDAVGRVVSTSTANVTAGASSLAVPGVGALPAGVYLLTVRQGGNTQVIRVAHE